MILTINRVSMWTVGSKSCGWIQERLLLQSLAWLLGFGANHGLLFIVYIGGIILRPGVDFSIVIVERFADRQSFSHEFEAKKFNVGKWRNWIERSLWNFRWAQHSRNGPLTNTIYCALSQSCTTQKSDFRKNIFDKNESTLRTKFYKS